MKRLGYFIFALIFNIARIFPVSDRKVVLFNGHNHGRNGNLLLVAEWMEKHTENRVVFAAKRDMFGGSLGKKICGVFSFFIWLPYQMATAGQLFLNDNFLALAQCRPSPKTQIIQLWHGAGALKRFGLPIEKDERVRKQVRAANQKITHLFVTSEQVIPYYEEAFGVARDRIYAAGIPIMDVYTESTRQNAARARFYQRYPKLQGKKLLLYTPTFRRTEEENRAILSYFPCEKLHERLGEEWVILVKLHPKYAYGSVEKTPYCCDVTDYTEITDLFFVSDMLITDYSSTIVEYVLLDKPIVLYAYDLQDYDRGFYRDYETTAPGPVAHSESELLELVSKEQTGERRKRFADMQYDKRDGKAIDRMMELLDSTKIK